MFHSFFKLFSSGLGSRTAGLAASVSRKLQITTRPVAWLTFAGLILCAILFSWLQPDLFKSVKNAVPFGNAYANTAHTSADATDLLQSDSLDEEEPRSKLDDLKQKQRVSSWISKRYRIAGKASDLFVHTAYKTAFELSLDPHLILAVMAVESRFNPYAESAMGAQGLMQVMSKVHASKFEVHGGVKYALDPVVNIKVGSRILKDYVDQKGSIQGALRSYVGAAAMSRDGGYGSKVMVEYRKLKAVASGTHPSALVPSKSSSRQANSRKKSATAEPIAEREEPPGRNDFILL